MPGERGIVDTPLLDPGELDHKAISVIGVHCEARRLSRAKVHIRRPPEAVVLLVIVLVLTLIQFGLLREKGRK